LLIVKTWLPDAELDVILGRPSTFRAVKFTRLLPVAKYNMHRHAENMDLAVAIGASILGSGTVPLSL